MKPNHTGNDVQNSESRDVIVQSALPKRENDEFKFIKEA